MPELNIEIRSDAADLAELWCRLQRDAVGGPHESFAWVDAWLRTAGHASEPLIAIGRNTAGDAVCLLPLTIRKHFGCNVLEWLASAHGNYASGLFDRNTWADPVAPRGEQLIAALLAVLPNVDAIYLECQPLEIGGLANPLADLPGVPAASAGYALPLNGNLENHYKSRFSPSYRSKLRRNERRLSEHGNVRFTNVGDTDERLDTVNFIIGQKRQWLAQRGIDDFLVDEKHREFYRELSRMPGSTTEPVTCIHKLSVGDETLAASLDLIFQNQFYGLVAATAAGPLQRYGPGKLLLKYTVEHLANEGVSVMDFGAGEEENKLRWCTQRRERHHSIVPVSAKGRIYTEALKATLLAKLQIKQSPGLWRLATQMRRWKSRPASFLPWLAAGAAALDFLQLRQDLLL